MPFINQDRQGPAHLAGYRPASKNYSVTRRLSKGNPPNGDQIAAGCVLPRTQTYSEAAAYQKKVKKRPEVKPVNKHQPPPASNVELAMQLANSGNVEDKSGGMKHHPFCSPELAEPELAARKALLQAHVWGSCPPVPKVCPES
ncbi:hypothetical protein DSO57_1037217 [Entomophthora muscae]|uniref:Uncharacterized protein n=2 Tax=Entomophthora muscae TaxID=34485 RepID=A0ACC2RTY0_9FUNG|nr:hypothetical protein DSO57_1023266 [Entomophthora muscae]KAJ9059858.1 hypothetical protein DSO57_1037217 [Entomophthora muscae]